MPQPEPNSQFGLVQEGGYIILKCQRLPIVIDSKARRTADGDQIDLFIWKLTGDREGDDARMHPNVYLDSPEDDFQEIRGSHASMWLVPTYKNSSGDLIGLLHEQEKYKTGIFRRVGLTVIPRYVSAENTFVNETLDENGHFKRVKPRAIKIV